MATSLAAMARLRQELTRRPGLDPPARRARASSTSTSTASGCPPRTPQRVKRPGHPAGVARRLDLPVAERPPAGRRHRRRRAAPVPLPPGLARPGATRRSTSGCSSFGRALSKAREQVLIDLGTEGMTPGPRLRGRRCGCSTSATSGSATTCTPRRTAASGSPRCERRHVRRQGQDAWSSPSSASPAIEHSIDDRRPRRGRGARGDAPPARAGDEELLAWKERPAAGTTVDCPGTSTTTCATYDGARGDRQGLPHLARDRARRRRPGRDRRAGRDQGLAQAGGGGGDEGGRGVPRQHPGARPLVVRRPAGGRRLRGGPHDRGGHPAQVDDPDERRRPSSGPPCGCSRSRERGGGDGSVHHGMQANPRSPR